MDKISGILPEKPRLKTEAEVMTPVRPGAPAFGRAEGSAEIRDRVNLSTVKNIGTQEIQNYRNPKEAKNVKIVEELSRSFFMNPVSPKGASSSKSSSDSTEDSTNVVPSGGAVRGSNAAPLEPYAKRDLNPMRQSPRIKSEEVFEETSELPAYSSPPSKVDSLDYYA